MFYSFVADGLYTNLLQTFLPEKCTFFMERPFCVLSPLWGLQATYAVHLGLIGKRVVDFLLVLIELFSLGVMAERLSV